MTDDVLPDFGRSDDMVLPAFDRGALAVAEQEQQRQRGEPNLPAPAYPPAVDLGFGGPARSQMTFGENVAGSFFTNTLPGVIGEAASNEAARGNAQPGGFQPSQLRNLSSRVRHRVEAESPEDAAARRETAYQRVFDQAAYDLSQSRITPQSVAGTVAGALADPVNVLSVPARVAIRGGEMALAGIRAIAPRLGRSETAARIAQSGVDAAITNTAIDPILQAGRIQSGGQEGYNPEQTALAPLVGGAAGALLRGAIEAPSFARREAQAFGVDPARIETPQSVGTEAAGVPAGTAGEARIATPEAPAAREGQVLPDAGPVQRQAEAVSPEPARIEAPAREPVDRGATVAPEQIVGAPDGGRIETGNAGDAGRIPEGPARDQGQEAQAGRQAAPEAGVVERDGIRFNDTRGGGSQLHGTSEPDLQPYGEHYSTKNYYGQGFYTTDAADVAYGYSRRGSQRTGGRFVYRVEETRPLRLLDGEAEIPANLRQLLEPDDTGRASDIEDVLRMAFDEKPKNVRELYDNVREIGTGEGLSADTIQEIFDVINYHTRSLGFDGMSHLGGLRTNTAPHRVVIYFNPESDIRVTRVDPREFAAPEPSRVAANDAEPQQFAAMARNQDVRQIAREEIAAREGVSPMARQTADTTADRRFPGRQELPGEASKPRSLPGNATPDEIRDFRIGVEQERLAERIGRKLEVDKRFTLRNAEGQYDFKQGVIRVRRFGDMEVFSHEFGHALEQQIRKDLGRDFDAIFTKHAAELAPLDANAKDPAKKTPREGFAEFMRMLINNPAYARRQAPNFASDLESLVSTKAPDIGQLITDAARISQIDSGMDPVQRAVAQIVPAGEPKGWAKFAAERKRYGLPDTLELWASRAYAAVVGGEGHWAAKFAANLKEAQFKKTGKPLGELYEADPYKRFRMLPGAEQSASDAFFNGVRRYGRGGQFEDPVSPSLHAALVDAGEGSATRVTNNPEEVRLFDAYLMARRASALYERWRAGDIKNPPVNMTEAEVQAAITSIEAMRPGYKAGADKVFAFSRAHWNRIHDAGIVPTNIWQAVVARGEDYVPLAREMNEGGSTRGSGSTGERGADIKRLQGSSREVKGPLQSLMRDVIQYERIIAENEMRLSFVRLAESGGEFAGRFIERVPNTELKAQTSDIAELIRQKVRQAGGDQTEAEVAIRTLEDMVGDDLTATVFRATETRPGNERIWFTWEGGERTAWKIGNDPWSANFYDAMVQMNAAERDMLNDMLGTANAFFSQMITQAPQFALGNLIADGMTRPFVAKHTGLLGRIPLTGMARGIYNHIAAREITKATAEVAPLSAMPGIQTVQSTLGYEREFARRYDAVGGIRGGPSTALLRELEDSGARALTLAPKGFKEATADLASLVQQGRGGAVVSEVAKKWVRFMDSTETMGRVGQMAMTYNHLRKMGIDEASATFESAFLSRDLLDYDRRGTLMRGWRKSLPFINPGIQGTDLGIRRAFGEPFIAAVQAYKRGGLDNLDLEQKNNLKNAVQVWGVLAAAVVFQVAYTLKMWEDPVYRRSSDWMRSQYWIFPLTEGASRDGSDDRAVTIRRPFDFAGAMLKATEAATLGIVRADPEGAKRVAHQLVDGFVPRQFQGLDNLAASSPFIRLLYEVPLGRQMGFDGGPPRDIIPQNLQKLSPRDQYTPHTSWVARQWGELTGKSPMMFDHVAQTMLATTGRDLSDAATGLSGQNANMTSADAFTKMFVGNVYRRQRGIGQAARDLTALMSGDQSKYGAGANSYAENRLSDPDRARTAFNAADDIGKSLMVLRAHAFTPADRQFHPLERGDAFLKLINTATRDLAWGEMTIQDRSRVRGQQRETIEMTPADSRALVNVLNAWGWEEINNSLVASGVPAYRNYNIIDTSARLQMIRSLHPRVADEIEARMKRLHIKPLEEVRRNWPEVQRRLITDQSAARLDDLHSGAAVRASARRVRTRQRVEESNNSD